MNNDITLGTMMVFMSLSSYFMDSVSRLVSLQLQLQEISIAIKRMSELYEVEEEKNDSDNLIKDFDSEGTIDIQDISFRYAKRSVVIEHISLLINKNEKIALVGESGGGKSTLAKLILGLYPLENGKIKIGNYDVDEIDKKELRKKIAYVPQNVELFSDMILNNIKFGNDKASYEDVKSASIKAGCYDFIERLPSKFSTYLDEAGNNLSGGERQRIALARALVKKPKILILDECTSNLDFISESTIYKNLFSLKCTIIFIAHRLSTIRNCDRICVVNNHTIEEIGTHEELLKKKGIYYKIYNSQIGEVNDESESPYINENKNSIEISSDNVVEYK